MKQKKQKQNKTNKQKENKQTNDVISYFRPKKSPTTPRKSF